MTEDQIQTFVDLVEWAEMLDADKISLLIGDAEYKHQQDAPDDLHPVDMAQAVEREIDAELAAQHADWLDEKRTLEDARY